MENSFTDKQKEEAQEVLNKLLDYTLRQVEIRMINYGEDFYLALENYQKEIMKEMSK